MNEQIRLLAKKAGIKEGKSFVYSTHSEIEGHSFSQESLENFAAVIVAECVFAVENHGGMCGAASSKKIKQHFGVEE